MNRKDHGIPPGVIYTRQDLSETEIKVTSGGVCRGPEVETRSYHVSPRRYFLLFIIQTELLLTIIASIYCNIPLLRRRISKSQNIVEIILYL